jgi:hypothetical protein
MYNSVTTELQYYNLRISPNPGLFFFFEEDSGEENAGMFFVFTASCTSTSGVRAR